LVQTTPQNYDVALRYLELALKIDPNYAPAYASMAMYWNASGDMGFTAPREAGPKAKAAALKALELDSTLPDGHYALALANYYYEWDWAGAEREYKRAIELNPNDASARTFYSWLLFCMKRSQEGLAESQRALELDPLNGFWQFSHASNLVMADREDEAIVLYQKVLRTSPGLSRVVHSWLQGILFRKARYEESLASVKANYAGDREMEEALTQGYAQSGYRVAMRRAADLLAGRARKTYVMPTDVATLYIWAGEKAQALAWLEKGFEVRDANLPLVNVHPDYDTLRSEPRFQELVRRMNLPQ